MIQLRRIQHGFTAIIVVVILVVFALIGVYLTTQVTTSSLSASSSYLGIQGWFAARSGAEWGVYEALHGGGCAASTVLTIEDFSVDVQCSSSAVSEGPFSYTVYDLSATATLGSPGDTIYISRVVNTSFTDI